MSDATTPPAPAARPCPICGAPSLPRWRPFCCKRCADVDLNRWLKGAYAVPAVADDGSAEDTPPERPAGSDRTP